MHHSEPKADYYLIRSPEVDQGYIDEQKTDLPPEARLPLAERICNAVISDIFRAPQLGKHESATLREIGDTLGPEVYRAAVKYDSRVLHSQSEALLDQTSYFFRKAPGVVGNDFASDHYSCESHAAYLRMWWDLKKKLIVIRLHDAARKQPNLTGKKPVDKEVLNLIDNNVQSIAAFVDKWRASSNKVSQANHLSRIVERECIDPQQKAGLPGGTTGSSAYEG